MEPIVREELAQRIERWGALDAVAAPLRGVAHRLVPEGTALKDALSGTWLGHPLHPMLTDVVVGSWMSALVLDRLGADDGADALVALGVAAALPTALSGLSDWADLPVDTRRVGTLHAFGNTAALVLHGVSLAERLRGRRARGQGLSAVGIGIAMASAWLGGHLSFGRGVGVNQTVFEDLPEDWTAVADEAEVAEGSLAGVTAGGTGVLLARQRGRIWALVDRCSHRGCALHEGTLGDGTVKCPCHGSTFRLEDGSIVTGPATAPQPRLLVRVRGGQVELRAADGEE
jgi:nitrite reductase/ring-hydroxylating ferredoxin subunit